MSDLSTYLEDQLLDLIFNGAPFSSPQIYVSLHTGDPGESGATNEITATNYDRQGPISWSSPVAGSGTEQQVENSNEIEFAQAQSNWGTISHVGLYDSQTGGNQLMSGGLKNARTIEAGDRPVFDAQDLIAALD
jgi:hypothetical protein